VAAVHARNALSEREREMAKQTSGKRGAAIIAVIAAFAALAGPGVASAAARQPVPQVASAPAAAPVAAAFGGFGIIASWAEEASWAES
jgi:hypothetical protein